MLTSLSLVFLLGMLLSQAFQKIRLPGLLGMLLTGMILGPYALNMLDASILGISADLRQIALIIILTRAGLSLDIQPALKLWGWFFWHPAFWESPCWMRLLWERW